MVPAILVLPIKRSRSLRLLMFVILGACFYSVYVGGDAWEDWGGSNRFVSPVMPLLFILFILGLEQLRTNAVRWLGLSPRSDGRLAWLLMIGVSVVLFNGHRRFEALSEWLLLTRPSDAMGNEAQVRIAGTVTRITTDRARVAVVRAGTVPYFSGRECVDLLGKSDRRIARLPMHEGYEFYPGHLKWDYAYSIGTLEPDLIVSLWLQPKEAGPYINQSYLFAALNGELLTLRKDSRYIHWNEVKRMTAEHGFLVDISTLVSPHQNQ